METLGDEPQALGFSDLRTTTTYTISPLVGRERLELPMKLISTFTVYPVAISGHRPNSTV